MDEMNLPTYKVYVKTDVHGCIISVEGTAFHTENELTGKDYVYVDEGTDGNIYAHCQPNFLREKHGKPMYDESGCPNFKLSDGVVTELSEEEKEEYFIKPAQKAQAVQAQNALLEQKMLASQKTTFLVSLPDEEALEVKYCHPEWSADSVSYEVGDRVLVDDELWKCRQAHTSQENWKPRIDTASLWEVVQEQHEGTIDDPIPYDMNMEVFKDKYYIENDVVYKCIRNSLQPLYSSCSSLVGNYFELVL